MSDPLVQKLRVAAQHAEETWLDEKWPCRLLERAADALESTAVREQRLRAALEQIVTIPRVFAGMSGYTLLGNELNAAVEQARQIARLALAGDALPAAPEQAAHA